MYCKNCGKEIDNDSNYCGSCGTRVSHQNTQHNKPLSAQHHFSAKTYKEVPLLHKDLEQKKEETQYVSSKKDSFDWGVVVIIILAIVGIFCAIIFWDWVCENYPIAFAIFFGIPFIFNVLKDIFD